jgi:hypothetical protein
MLMQLTKQKKKCFVNTWDPHRFYTYIYYSYIYYCCVCVCVAQGPNAHFAHTWTFFFSSGTPNLMAIWREKGLNRGRVASLVDSHMQVKK